MLVYAMDDEPILLETLVHCIHEASPEAEVTGFNNPNELIDEMNKRPCDVAFLDILMPEKDGLQLAREILEIKADTNIIFVTAYEEYMKDAFGMFASGFISKPISIEKTKQQFEHLRYAVSDEKPKRTFAKTFGNFTLLVDGKSISFARKKSLMLFAYLVHRNGSVVNRREMSEIIFEDSEGGYDSNKQSYMSKLCADIEKTLGECGIFDVFQQTPQGMRVDVDKFDCDLYEYLKDKENSRHKYCGQYMEQYSFSEEIKGSL